MTIRNDIFRTNRSRVWLNRTECIAIAGCTTNELLLGMLVFIGYQWVPREAFVRWLTVVKSLDEKQAEFDLQLFLAQKYHELERTTDFNPLRCEYYRIDMSRGRFGRLRLSGRYLLGIKDLSERLLTYTGRLPKPYPEGEILSC